MGDKLFQSRTSDHPEFACPIEESPTYMPMPSGGMGNPLSCLRLFPSYESEALSPSAIAHRANPPGPKHESIANTVAHMRNQFEEQHGDRTEWMIGVPGGVGLPGVVGGIINAAGGRRGMVEIAKGILGLLSDPKTIPQKLVELAEALERNMAQTAHLRSEFNSLKDLRSNADRVKAKQKQVARSEADEAELAKQITTSTNELLADLRLLAQQNLPLFLKVSQHLAELRSQLPRHQPK